MVFLLLLLMLNFQQIKPHTIHIASACFSKRFSTANLNELYDNDSFLRNNGMECGEDDFFTSKSGDIYLLTVADGIGAWSKDGLDTKIYTQELLKSMSSIFKSLSEKHLEEHDAGIRSFLLDIVTDAQNDVQKNKQFVKHGSCTVVALSLNSKTLHLNSYNLGDSGFMIIRDGEIMHRSHDMQHFFNVPYQLAFIDEYSSLPETGVLHPFNLQVNDIIIIGSDGLFDNLFDEAILYYVQQETKHLSPIIQKEYSEAPRRIAKKLTFLAKQIGETENVVATPYSEELNRLKFTNVYEGKNDDTTVTVVLIS